MYSKTLQDLGLSHVFLHKPYDFRAKTQGPRVKDHLDQALKEEKIFPQKIYSAYQVHSNKIQLVDEKAQGKDFFYGEIFLSCDGLVTPLKNRALLIKVADCCPILLYDPLHGVLANLHAGWKGTLGKISLEALDLMASHYGTRPQDLVAYIGPSIGFKDFEIMEDLKTQWDQTLPLAKDLIQKKDANHFLLDLKETNRRLLLEAGLAPGKIEVSPLSTYSDPRLHSYRRDKKAFGLNALVAMMT
ncbi:MAG: peptidoglycan editing factor PgeF [Tissierellia bacterium]|nr:peptidoglycan editing factor PgeF [Tissierellia bacterium]